MSIDFLPSINNNVYRQFPELSGVQPSIQQQATSKGASGKTSITYLLIYHSKAQVGNHNSMPRVVRVVVNEQGKILKLTTSR